ncbi:MAG TPA: ester cyclase [Dehalococcoidia bacterium]|nr:ester cyclase [Dehalococcoidia bacterium]
MPAEDNKAIVRRVIEELWNEGNPSLFADLFGPEAHADTTEQHRQNALEMEQMARLYCSALPDHRVTIDDLLADGEKVIVRFTARGTHNGVVQGVAGAEAIAGIRSERDPYRTLLLIPPTGREVTFEGIALFGFSEGKVASFWHLLDELEVLRQVGALPMVGSTPHR